MPHAPPSLPLVRQQHRTLLLLLQPPPQLLHLLLHLRLRLRRRPLLLAHRVQLRRQLRQRLRLDLQLLRQLLHALLAPLPLLLQVRHHHALVLRLPRLRTLRQLAHPMAERQAGQRHPLVRAQRVDQRDDGGARRGQQRALQVVQQLAHVPVDGRGRGAGL